jgi:uncharacterized phiE125 gp8 family phage protein
MITDNYVVKTPATEQPVTLTEVKAWCKITNATEDALITALIKAATEKAEKFTNRVFITRTFTGHISGLDRSPCYEVGVFLTLRRAPLGSVTSVKVLEDDTLETVSSDDYNVKDTGGFPRIVFEEVNDSPDRVPYPYQVEFVAGYGAAAAVPDAIKTAIMEAVCYWHSNRGDCGGGDELPGIAKGILREFKIINTFA